MILFLEDWRRYPAAIPDYKTTNRSFLEMADKYAQMGVRNALCILALHNPALQGVDPFDRSLSAETKLAIATECQANPWYFFREIVRIPPNASSTPVPFKANRGNLAMIWSFFNNIDVALIQPRQTGKSVSTDTLMVWLLFIGARGSRINMITKDDTLRVANVERLKKIRNYLPPYVYLIARDDSDNKYELTCNALGNTYTTGVSQNSEIAANNLGRGLTAPITHFDEGPFIKYIETTLPAALAAATAAREEAELNRAPYGNIFTTTAGKRDDRDGKFMYDFIHGGAPWMERYMDCRDRNEARKMVATHCSGKKLIINATFNHRQLGKTDKWLYDAMAEAASTGEAADRDFLNVWTSGTQSSPLSAALNEIIKKSEMEPLHTEISRSLYVMRWYIDELAIARRMKEEQWMLGVDTSDAVGRDAIGMVLTSMKDLSVVAATTLNETNLYIVAEYITELLIKYPNMTLMIERKSSAPTIIDIILLKLTAAGIDPFRRIYNRMVERYEELKPDERAAIDRPVSLRSPTHYDQYKQHFGFVTTGESREQLYGMVLQNAAKIAGKAVHDKTLSSEIRSLVVKNGRIDHLASGHDDMVISWLMPHWTVWHSRNLYMYGIDTSNLKASITTTGERITPVDQFKRAEQQRIQTELDRLIAELKDSNDEFIAMKLEHRIKTISTLADGIISDAYNVDSLIHEAKESRLRNSHTASALRKPLNINTGNILSRRGPWGYAA